MAEQPHTLVYRGLPPVVRHPVRRWLIIGGVFAFAVLVVAVPVFAFTYAVHASPSSWWGGGGRPGYEGLPSLDWHLLTWIGGVFIVGGLLGAAYARGWWSMFAVDAVGCALVLALAPLSATDRGLYGAFFWVFGVSAGVGIRNLIQRRRVLRASYLSQPG